MDWFVYILRCNDGSLYTGIAKDVQRRLEEHNHSPLGAKYTRGRRPVTLVYSEAHESRSDASKRECELKAMDRKAKLALINQPSR